MVESHVINTIDALSQGVASSKNDNNRKIKDNFKSSSSTSVKSRNQNQIKERIRLKTTPFVLNLIIAFGFFTFGLMILILLTDFAILQGKYTMLKEQAGLSTLPSQLQNSIIRATDYTVLMLFPALNIMNAQTSATFTKLYSNAAELQYTSFSDTVNKYLINTNTNRFGSNFDLNDFAINLTFFTNVDLSREVNFYEAISIFSGYLNLLTQPNITKEQTLEIFRFFAKNALNFSNLLEQIQSIIFEQIRDGHKDLHTYIQYLLIFGVLVSIIISLFTRPAYRKFEKNEETILSRLSFINNGTLIPELVKVKVLLHKLKNIHDLDQERYNKNHSFKKITVLNSRNNSNTAIKKVKLKKTSVPLLFTFLTLLGSLYAMYFIPLYTTLVRRIDDTIPYFAQNEVITQTYASVFGVHPLLHGLMTSVVDRSLFNNDQLNKLVEAKFQKLVSDKKKLLNIIATHQVEENSLTTNELRETYKSFDDNSFCEELLSSFPNSCNTVLNGTSSNGFIVFFNQLSDMMVKYKNDLLYNQVKQTTIDIVNSDTYFSVTLGWYALNVAMQRMIDLYSNQMVSIAYNSEKQLIYLVVFGAMYYILLFSAIWIPFIKNLKRKYIDSIRVYRLLPVSVLVNNVYIKAFFS